MPRKEIFAKVFEHLQANVRPILQSHLHSLRLFYLYIIASEVSLWSTIDRSLYRLCCLCVRMLREMLHENVGQHVCNKSCCKVALCMLGLSLPSHKPWHHFQQSLLTSYRACCWGYHHHEYLQLIDLMLFKNSSMQTLCDSWEESGEKMPLPMDMKHIHKNWRKTHACVCVNARCRCCSLVRRLNKCPTC